MIKPCDNINSSDSDNSDTVVYPLVQMGPFRISVDDTVTQTFLRSAPRESKIYMASGYFNVTEHYKHLIVNDAKADFDILMASPKVMFTSSVCVCVCAACMCVRVRVRVCVCGIKLY